LRLSVAALKSIIEKQTLWIADTEASLQSLLLKKVSERYGKECSCAERLIAMIGERIELAKPIMHRWLLASDVIAVLKNVLLAHPDPPAVVPTLETQGVNKLNVRQLTMLDDWIDSISLGGVVLEQDLLSLLDRALNPIGPFRTKSHLPEGVMRHLTFPKLWRDLEFSTSAHNSLNSDLIEDLEMEYKDGIRKHLFRRDKVHGVDEHVGTICVESLLSLFGGTLP
jgi:hypothetical protein